MIKVLERAVAAIAAISPHHIPSTKDWEELRNVQRALMAEIVERRPDPPVTDVKPAAKSQESALSGYLNSEFGLKEITSCVFEMVNGKDVFTYGTFAGYSPHDVHVALINLHSRGYRFHNNELYCLRAPSQLTPAQLNLKKPSDYDYNTVTGSGATISKSAAYYIELPGGGRMPVYP